MGPREFARPAADQARCRHAFSLLIGALLLSTALLSLLPPAAAHPYHLQESNEPLTLEVEEAHAAQWLAQSFVPEKNYSISRVALHLADKGVSDVLAVFIRPDSAGAPGTDSLTEGSVDGPDMANWVEVDLSPFASLTLGATYWIVVRSQEPEGDGYDWSRSTLDSYGNGTGATSPDGVSWTNLLGDLTFQIYGFDTPEFEYSISAIPNTLEPGNATTLRVWFNNTGTTSAEKLWINVTYPNALGYVSDDASGKGGVRTGSSYEFTNVTPGNYSFNITAEAQGGVADGTVAEVSLTFEARDHADAPTTHDEREAFVTIHNAVLSYDTGASATTLRPTEEAALQFTIENTGNGSATNVWVNLTLPSELIYVNDDAAGAGGDLMGTYSFAFTNKSAGATVFNVTVAAAGGVQDGTVATANATFEGTDAPGSPLNTSAVDLAITIRNARLQVVLDASSPTADPGDQVIFVGNVTNTGSAAATNLTLLGYVDPNATYVSSTPSGTWDPANGTVRWNLSRLEVGASTEVEWTVEILPGTEDNTTLAAWLRAEYEDDTGTTMLAANVTAGADVQAPVFAPILRVDPAVAQRYDEVTAYLYYNNTGGGRAALAWANWTLDGRYTLLSLVPDLPHALTADGFAVNLTDVAPGDHFLVARLRVLPSEPDGLAMNLTVSWTATDANGYLLPPGATATSVTLQAPSFSPVLRLNRTSVQRGDLVEATVEYPNTGSATARWIWLNWSLGGHYDLVSFPEELPHIRVDDSVAFLDPEVAPGNHSLTVTLQVIRGLDDGLALPLEVRWSGKDGSGYPLPETLLGALTELHAPSVALIATGPGSPIPTGSTFDMNVTLSNDGRAPATGTLSLALPSGVAYLDADGPLDGTLDEGKVLWPVASLAPGQVILLQVRLRAIAAGERATLQWAFTGTDGRGSPPETTSSNPVELNFLPAPPLLGLGEATIGAIVALGTALLVAVLLLRRRGSQPNIEEVFVVDAGGTLLAHLSHSLLADRDEDILAAMLTAVRQFIQDAFSQGTEERLRTLEFGERSILVESGPQHSVAVVCRRPDEKLKERLRGMSQEIESRWGPILEDWNGDMGKVRGIQNVLRGLWEGDKAQEG